MSNRGILWMPFLLTGAALLYLNLILTNLVSFRQYQYAKMQNKTFLEPLHDTFFVDWTKAYNIDQYVSLSLRDMVDVCTYGWVLTVCLFWCVRSKEAIYPAKVLAVQMIVIPCFAATQLLTIVPDSQPNCIQKYNIPRTDDISWIFWRWPYRACGDMLWSSDIAQLSTFTSIAVEMVGNHRKKAKWAIWIISQCWIFITMIFIFSSRYQYTMDVLITFGVVKLLVTHPFIEHVANYYFVKRGQYYSRAPSDEKMTI
jgi:hypothetical protein